MANIVHSPQDEAVLAVKSALDQYEQQFRGAEAALYRQNSGSIRVRVIDDRFAGMPKSRRHDLAWQFLADRVGDEAMSEVSLLLLLPRSELGSSLMNVEFEHPTDSRL